jgi:hypothetical protein
MPKFLMPKIEYAQVETINEKINWEEAVSIGMELRNMKDNSQWDLGDLGARIDKDYGGDSLGKFANEIGINKKSMQQYRRVSLAFPKSKRIDLLSHRHHLILAAREDRNKWLKKAADNTWTVRQLQRELKMAEVPEEEQVHNQLLVTLNKDYTTKESHPIVNAILKIKGVIDVITKGFK